MVLAVEDKGPSIATVVRSSLCYLEAQISHSVFTGRLASTCFDLASERNQPLTLVRSPE